MKLAYSIYPTQLQEIKAVLCEDPVMIGTGITINGVEHEAKQIEQVKVILFLASGVVKVKPNDRIPTSDHLSKIVIKNLGFNSKRDFTRSIFRYCELFGSTAERELFLVNFTPVDWLSPQWK